MVCSQCGKDVPSDSPFCRNCGQTRGVASTGGGAAAAVAPARIKTTEPKTASTTQIQVTEARTVSPLWWALPILLAVIGAAWFGSATRRPTELANSVASIPAQGWHSVAIEVPYAGSLTISANVQHGNPMMMYLTNDGGPKGLEAGNRNTCLDDFCATQTNDFQHTGLVNQGTYYFVIHDDSPGIPSHSSSDVALKVSIEPWTE